MVIFLKMDVRNNYDNKLSISGFNDVGNLLFAQSASDTRNLQLTNMPKFVNLITKPIRHQQSFGFVIYCNVRESQTGNYYLQWQVKELIHLKSINLKEDDKKDNFENDPENDSENDSEEDDYEQDQDRNDDWNSDEQDDDEYDDSNYENNNDNETNNDEDIDVDNYDQTNISDTDNKIIDNDVDDDASNGSKNRVDDDTKQNYNNQIMNDNSGQTRNIIEKNIKFQDVITEKHEQETKQYQNKANIIGENNKNVNKDKTIHGTLTKMKSLSLDNDKFQIIAEDMMDIVDEDYKEEVLEEFPNIN